MRKSLLVSVLLFCTLLYGKELPLESSIKWGKLNNGMTYSIKKNEKPKGMGEFRLLVKAGSLEEDDDQKGLAHFTEHMAFNGSKHFKKNELIQYLESIGVSFGKRLNASTGYERTLYKLSVPLKNDNLEKSFLVFKDWASNLTFDKEQFDKERGVILEEARSRDNLNFRLFNQIKPLLYTDSKYLDRTPIGDLEIIRNVDVKRAKDFYDKWYRPELMHFTAVGDFDEKQIEKLIVKHFSKLENKNRSKRASRHIPVQKNTRVKFVTDPEVTSNSLSIRYLEKMEPLRSEKDLKKGLVDSAVLTLFNQKGGTADIKIRSQSFDDTYGKQFSWNI